MVTNMQNREGALSHVNIWGAEKVTNWLIHILRDGRSGCMQRVRGHVRTNEA